MGSSQSTPGGVTSSHDPPVKQEPKNVDPRLDQFFDSFRAITRSLENLRTQQVKADAEEANVEQDIWTGFTCFQTELPPEMIRLILSFLSPTELFPLRFISKSFHLLIEQVMEQWVKNLEKEEETTNALFTAYDYESGLYSDVFGSWSDVARNKYLYERQLVPSCCTTEQIEQLRNSRNVMGQQHGGGGTPQESPMIKLSIVGRERAGKTMWCQHVTSDQTIGPHNYEATIGANFWKSSFSIDGSKTVHTFGIWDTAGQERFKSLMPMYLRNSLVVLIMIPLDGSSTDSIEWLENLLAQHCLTSEMKCIVVGTKSDLKKDNRLSYDLLSHCTRKRIPYYECDLTDSDQMFRVLYAMIHYGLWDYRPAITVVEHRPPVAR